MKKIILTILIALNISVFTQAENIQTGTIIKENISKINVDFPSIIRIIPSNDDNTRIRIRTDKKWLLDSIYLDSDNNGKLYMKSKYDIESFIDSNVIIYLETPKDIEFSTTKENLFVNVQHKNKQLTNNETQK